MAVEIKLIFGAISILLGLLWIGGFNGSIANRFDPYANFRTASDAFYSDSEKLTHSNFNNTEVRREIQRNVFYERDNSRIVNLPRNSIDFNLRSYFREKDSRIEEAFNRNRRSEQLRSRNFDIDRRQFDTQNLRKRANPFESERRERLSDNFRYRLERSPFERIRFDERNSFKDEFRNFENQNFRFDRRLARDSFRVKQEREMFRRRNRDSDFRVELRDREDRRIGRDREISRERNVIRSIGNNFKNFFQFVWEWGALINSSLDGISNYLFTIIAGLFIFDTVGQFIPVKATEEKGLTRLFRNFASVTGNVMVH